MQLLLMMIGFHLLNVRLLTSMSFFKEICPLSLGVSIPMLTFLDVLCPHLLFLPTEQNTDYIDVCQGYLLSLSLTLQFRTYSKTITAVDTERKVRKSTGYKSTTHEENIYEFCHKYKPSKYIINS